MIFHIVLWTLNDPADQPRFRDLLESCRDLVPGMLEFTVGGRADALPAGLDANADVALVSRFDSAEALQAYLHHPRHKAVGAQLGPLRQARTVLDWVA